MIKKGAGGTAAADTSRYSLDTLNTLRTEERVLPLNVLL
jgi:hypothetical protein